MLQTGIFSMLFNRFLIPFYPHHLIITLIGVAVTYRKDFYVYIYFYASAPGARSRLTGLTEKTDNHCHDAHHL